jgi:hypothetical protein
VEGKGMKTLLGCKQVFIFDVESIGIHGPAWAWASGVFDIRTGNPVQEDHAFIDIHSWGGVMEDAKGRPWWTGREWNADPEDLKWVLDNCPRLTGEHSCVSDRRELMDRFRTVYERAAAANLPIAAETPWPVEANFLSQFISHRGAKAKWAGPYPLWDITTMTDAAGMDAMKIFHRMANERPEHDPRADIRLSARLLSLAYNQLRYAHDAAFEKAVSYGTSTILNGGQ